jgi:oxygen-dependent protoporphyrinogen oxidase
MHKINIKEKNMKKVVILGAGISGLALLWFLKQKYQDSVDFTILEQKKNAGGWIKTIQAQGFLFDLGCRSCRTSGNGIKTLELIESLNLEAKVITANPDAKKRYIYINQRLECFPNGIYSFLKSTLTKGLIKAVCKDLFFKSKTKKSKEGDESIHEFITRRFSKEMAENLFDPLTSGIYAGNIKKLSLKACFPTLAHYEDNYGSVVKGMIFDKKTDVPSSPFVKFVKSMGIFSFKDGMQTLTDCLSNRLKQHIIYDVKINTLEFYEEKTRINFEDGSIIDADHVFSTIPAHCLHSLVQEPNLSQALCQFQSASVATVSFGFKRAVLKPKGFGYLIPSKEKEEILGVVFDSSVFKEHNSIPNMTRITVMIGGAHFTHFDSYSKEDFHQMALKAISKHLNINEIPDFHHVELFLNAIPQYLIGHSNRVKRMEALRPAHFKILGSSFYGVSVNDCIAQAKLFANIYTLAS